MLNAIALLAKLMQTKERKARDLIGYLVDQKLEPTASLKVTKRSQLYAIAAKHGYSWSAMRQDWEKTV